VARILVIDDETNIRTMVRMALEHSGHVVETASDGDEGLDKYGDGSNWDLVLLDQRMPGLEGTTVLNQIRYYNPVARVIMITAYGTIDLAVQAMKSGATDFLRKPFTVETLRGAVDAALKEMNPAACGSGYGAGPRLTFGMTTINGFRVEFQPGAGLKIGSDIGFRFSVRSPTESQKDCTVVLSPVVVELIKAHTDRDTLPGGPRFWQSVCEEALANYLYQHADFPPDGLLRIDEFSSGLQRFVDSILPALR
jgi:DNA-binding response OmpR family regulator